MCSEIIPTRTLLEIQYFAVILLFRVSILCITRERILHPVCTSASVIQVHERRCKVLPHPRVVRISHAVFLAHFSHRRGNVGVPGRTHARKQVVFHLKVESTSQVPRDETAVRRRCFHLALEPADWLASLFDCSSGIAIGILKVV